MSVDQKKQYFNGRIKATNTLHHHFDLDKDTYEFFIYTEIVDVIIGNLFFRDDKQLENIDADDGKQNPADAVRKKVIEKQNKKKNAMKLFCKEDDAPVYTVTIRTSYASTWPWTMSALACCSDRRQQPSRKPRIARRWRNLLVSMIASSVSTCTSWSLSRCNRSSASSTMSKFGP